MRLRRKRRVTGDVRQSSENGERVRVPFALDCCDRAAMSSLATAQAAPSANAKGGPAHFATLEAKAEKAPDRGMAGAPSGSAGTRTVLGPVTSGAGDQILDAAGQHLQGG